MNRGAFTDALGVVAVGRELGRGGEGAVHEVTGRPGVAVKLYFDPDTAREAKIRILSGGGYTSTCPSAAVPRTLVRSADGAFAGFTMRMVDGYRPLHDLYGTASRRQHFPGADWRMIVRTAANVARAVAEVHAAGLVIGDINHSSMLVSQRSLVTLIDADSWQCGPDALCRVGVPEYVPPELQGRSLDGVVRTESHDSFGLAVLLAQLLFLGRHPFAGVPVGQPLALPDAIARYQFAYTLVRDVRLRPPNGTLLLSELPPAVRVGFERAFGNMLGPRYTPARWASVLADLELDLVDCSSAALHWMPSAASSCPWCRIEKLTGRSAFGAVAAAGKPVGVVVDHPEVASVRAFLNGINPAKLTHIEPRSSRKPVQHSQEAVAFAARNNGKAHAALLRSVLDLAGGVSDDPFTRRHTAAELAVVRAMADWRRRIGVEPVLREMAALRRDLVRVGSVGSSVARASERPAFDGMVDAALRDARVATARVPGLAAARRAILHSAGVVTAADVSRRRLATITGLGAQCVAALLIWRDDVAASAGRSGPSASSARERAAAIAAVDDRDRRGLLAGKRALEVSMALLELMKAFGDEVVERARSELASAAADLRFLKLPLPGDGTASSETGKFVAALQGASRKTKAGGKTGRTAEPSTRAPVCPKCNAPMARRWSSDAARRVVLGCTRYPKCDGKRTVTGRRI